MWVNFECKKRNWGLEFEEMEAEVLSALNLSIYQLNKKRKSI